MSINYNRKITKDCIDNKSYNKLQLQFNYPPYWDDCLYYVPTGNRRRRSIKQLFNYQRRMYKTWKHNRLNQWKQ